MKFLACGALLLAAGVGQQQGPPPNDYPPDTPPNVPQEQAPEPAVPGAPSPSIAANRSIQQQIQKDLSAEPGLSDSVVDVAVDDNSIVLMGTVGDEEQHATALRIAASYAGDRVIVDGIKPQEKEGYHL